MEKPVTDLYQKIPSLYRREDARPHRVIIGEYRDPVIEQLAGLQWVFTEKVDGTNIRIIWDGHKVTFGGRTENAQLPTPLLARLTELFGGDANEQVFEETFGPKQVVLFGEGYGPKIQKGGGNYRPDQDFVLFDVTVNGGYLSRESTEGIAARFGLDVVPVVLRGTIDEAVELVRDGLVSTWDTVATFYAEGLIGRPTVDLYTREGERIIVKIKHADLYAEQDFAA